MVRHPLQFLHAHATHPQAEMAVNLVWAQLASRGAEAIGATLGYFAGIATYLTQYAVLREGLLGNLLPQLAAVTDLAQQNLVAMM